MFEPTETDSDDSDAGEFDRVEATELEGGEGTELTLDRLPADVLREIFLYLIPHQQAELSRLCRHFRDVLHDPAFTALNALRLEHLLNTTKSVPKWLCLATRHWHLDSLDLMQVVPDILLQLQERMGRRLKLESIAIGPRAHATDRDIAQVVKLIGLVSINIHAGDITSEVIALLSQLPNLRECTLHFAKCRHIALPPLPYLRSVQILGAKRLEDVSSISSCPALEELVLNKCVRLEAIRFGAEVTNLTRISLYGCERMDDSALSSLADATSLLELDISGCVNIDGTGFRHLQKLSIQCIYACECPRICADGIRWISNFPLSELDLEASECDLSLLIPDRFFAPLAAVTTLERLVCVFESGRMNLSNRLHTGAVDSFHFIQQLVNLERLDLSFCTLTVGHLLCLARLKRLRVLNLSRSRSMMDDMLKAISHFPALHTLDIVNCVRVTPRGVASLQSMRHLSRLKVHASLQPNIEWYARLLPRCRVELYGAQGKRATKHIKGLL